MQCNESADHVIKLWRFSRINKLVGATLCPGERSTIRRGWRIKKTNAIGQSRSPFDGIDWPKLVSRTAGVRSALIRELVCKAAIFAAEESSGNGELLLREAHLDEALGELLVAGGALTQTLLGVDGRGKCEGC
jgi:hypothetical protein